MKRPFDSRTHDDEDRVNLTPMLDVVFIMLIFFIVTATFVNEVGLDVNQPDPNKSPPVVEDKQSIVVRISDLNRITIAHREVDWRAVRANIERLHGEAPEASVVIQAHSDSSTETLVYVMDQSRLAGVYDILLAAN